MRTCLEGSSVFEVTGLENIWIMRSVLNMSIIGNVLYLSMDILPILYMRLNVLHVHQSLF